MPAAYHCRHVRNSFTFTLNVEIHPQKGWSQSHSHFKRQVPHRPCLLFWKETVWASLGQPLWDWVIGFVSITLTRESKLKRTQSTCKTILTFYVGMKKIKSVVSSSSWLLTIFKNLFFYNFSINTYLFNNNYFITFSLFYMRKIKI